MNLIEQYRSEGLSFIPIPFKSKIPVLDWKQYQSQLPNDAEIKSWFNGHESNIAVICGKVSGNLVVLDCDSEAKFIEIESIICRRLGIDDIRDFTRISQTSRGYHIWLRTKEPLKSQKFPALDIKGEGGYIIVPPSIHPEGDQYQFINDTPIATISNLKQIGIDTEQNNDVPRNQPGWVSQLLASGAGEGQRNNEAIRLTGYFRNLVPKEVTETILLDWNHKNRPPLPENELIRTIASGYKLPGHPLATPTHGTKESIYMRQNLSLVTEPDKNRTENQTNDKSEIENRTTLSQRVKEWIETTNGWWDVKELDYELDIPREDKDNRSRIMSRLRVEGIIERHLTQNKMYRRVIKNLRKIDFKNISIKQPLALRLPLQLDKLVNVYPGNIIVVAGSPDSGKTAWLLNLIRMNMEDFPIYYLNSEMGETELANRLGQFEGIEINDWNFTAEECSSNFTDAIRPDAVNIIDYLEISKDVFLVAEYMKAIHDKLGSGIAVIALQKKRGAELGRGAEFSLEKPRLYLSMDSGITTIQKAKNWAKTDVNPNKLRVEYNIIGGCKFKVKKQWQYEDGTTPQIDFSNSKQTYWQDVY